jgi:ABC-2 type transport system ATP-binding protein
VALMRMRTLHRAAPDRTEIGMPVILARDVSRRFGSTQALDGVSLDVRAGEIHALLGPNGAGKTTLLRILSGLVDPDAGDTRVFDIPTAGLRRRRAKQMIGHVPSGDRTFYLRISGLENLVFFARLHGLTRREARERAVECLEAVGLLDTARTPAGRYSHGMQKRLSVARALLMDPPVLLVDEATHDLDPEGARRVRELITQAASRGRAIVWATQRVDEIRGFVHRLTLLHRGRVGFAGGVPEFMAISRSQAHLVHLADGTSDRSSLLRRARQALGGAATLEQSGDADGEHCVLMLGEAITLGEAISRLAASGLQVLGCREERSQLEESFLSLTSGSDR